jgi:hypothetical protein
MKKSTGSEGFSFWGRQCLAGVDAGMTERVLISFGLCGTGAIYPRNSAGEDAGDPRKKCHFRNND